MKTQDRKSKMPLDPEASAFRSLMWKSLAAASLGIPMFIWGFIGTKTVTTGFDQVVWIVIGVISFFVLWYSGGHFYSGAWQSIKAHRANMYTLISVATGPAWIYSFLVSVWPTLFPVAAREVHYDAPLTIVALIVFGAAFEMKASAKVSETTKKLATFLPKRIRVIRNNKPQEISVEELQIGDVAEVLVNERISVDGEVIEGHSVVDETILSRERSDVTKDIGDEVFAGTMNQSTPLRIQVTRVHEDSALKKIINTIKQAQNSKPSIAGITDKIAAIFAPLVLIIAVLTPLIWYNFGPLPQIAYMLITFMAVLLIACPCALGLATPISITAGVGKASKLSILFRTGEAIQLCGRLTTLFLDQSGIITEEKPSIVAIQTTSKLTEDQLLQYVMGVSDTSDHPFSLKLNIEAKKRSLEVLSISNPQGQQVLLGDEDLMREHQVDINTLPMPEEARTQSRLHYWYLSINGQMAGRITFLYRIKSDAKSAIKKLQSTGLNVQLLSHRPIELAKALATEVGIENVMSDIKLEDKINIITYHHEKGERIAFVGNGVEDQTLKLADIGFAMGSKAYKAESADVIVLGDSLFSLVDSIGISKAIMRNIKQNLTGAFVYNTLGIPLAAGILYPLIQALMSPILAGALMACSSLGVVLNANRLGLYRPAVRRRK